MYSHREDCAKESQSQWKKESARLQGQFGQIMPEERLNDQALGTQGELSLTRLKNRVKAKAPFFDWAIGWLAREDQIVITPEKRSFRILWFAKSPQELGL